MATPEQHTLVAGYQRHPSTHTAHYFEEGERQSICKREQRMIPGEMEAETTFMVCSHCERAMKKSGIK